MLEYDIDVESDCGEDLNIASPNSNMYSKAEKRAHHNALERKRRDHIKDSFRDLRNALPPSENPQSASRATILKKAIEYTTSIQNRITTHKLDIEQLQQRNNLLESRIRLLQEAQTTGNYPEELSNLCSINDFNMSDCNKSDDSESEAEERSLYQSDSSGNDTEEIE